APSASKRKAAARSPDSAASSKVGLPAANAIDPAGNKTAMAIATQRMRISDLRDSPAAIADLLHRNVISVEYRQQQVRETRVLRIFHVLAALDTAMCVAEQSSWERIVVVPVAVAHVAAEKNRGVIEHSAVGFRRLQQTLDEFR